MRKVLTALILLCTGWTSWAQNFTARWAEVQSNSTTQEGIDLVSTYGEGIVNSETQGDIIIVQGWYSGIVGDTASGVIYPDPLSGLHSYPNPVNAELTITTEDLHHAQYLVRLMNSAGIQIKDWIWSAGEAKTVIHLQGIPSGVYLLTIRDDLQRQESVMKVVKRE